MQLYGSIHSSFFRSFILIVVDCRRFFMETKDRWIAEYQGGCYPAKKKKNVPWQSQRVCPFLAGKPFVSCHWSIFLSLSLSLPFLVCGFIW